MRGFELTIAAGLLVRGGWRAHSGGWVTVADLGARISPHAAHPDVVVRRARAGWEERIGVAVRE